jgi:hypothetical protein
MNFTNFRPNHVIRPTIVGFALILIPLFILASEEIVEVYGGPYDDRSTAVLRLSDGDLMVTGYSMSAEPFTNVLLSRFDSAVNHLWSRKIGNFHPVYTESWGQPIVSTQDGGFVVSATTVISNIR